jgi:hypothetical protein
LILESLGRERAKTMKTKARTATLGPSRGTVYKLAALFSLDSFAGGFAVQSLVALWVFERFDLSLAAASMWKWRRRPKLSVSFHRTILG